ncbi:MAG: transketolase [Gammaproteobacteria bacterium]|nr:transketolase [Gammaproteobacteria bacterium]
MSKTSQVERANAIRALAMDAVELAQSGHPGAPMGLADFAEVLWREYLKINPTNPGWVNRDRVVLSNGHASMLLYAVMHLAGYEISIEDIKQFRQLHSKTPGHPEFGITPGIETTTGPLGQGFANAVGMAIAERQLAQTFNTSTHTVVDHRTWVIVGDGCLMEGISHEAASLAGTLQLDKLVAIYDNNGISIDGETSGWFTEDVVARFQSYGWRVFPRVDGHDPEAIQHALHTVTSNSCHQPTLIDLKTTIGYGAPTKAGTAATHGAALGSEEVQATRENLDWLEQPFKVPPEIAEDWNLSSRGSALETEWNAEFDSYAETHPELAAEFQRRMNGLLPPKFDTTLNQYLRDLSQTPKAVATRKASGACLDVIGPMLPELIGGSADLTGSNNTEWQGAGKLMNGGRYINFGVREFAMTAIANGLSLHGGFIPYTGTFLVFMEYARNAVRLAALMELQHIFVYTHDSVGLGEDGPTHQPVEQLTNLRTTPNFSVWRPCDGVETLCAWRFALCRTAGPTALVLTRQNTVQQTRTNDQIDDIERGGYILKRESDTLQLIVLATGSEVSVAIEAGNELELSGIGTRVVSIPSTDQFLAQDQVYREQVIPSKIRTRIAIEAAHPDYWRKFVGLDGKVIGIDRFGVSAPGDIALNYMGIHAQAIIDAAQELLEDNISSNHVDTT